jgi:hypothetical protein
MRRILHALPGIGARVRKPVRGLLVAVGATATVWAAFSIPGQISSLWHHRYGWRGDEYAKIDQLYPTMSYDKVVALFGTPTANSQPSSGNVFLSTFRERDYVLETAARADRFGNRAIVAFSVTTCSSSFRPSFPTGPGIADARPRYSAATLARSTLAEVEHTSAFDGTSYGANEAADRGGVNFYREWSQPVGATGEVGYSWGLGAACGGGGIETTSYPRDASGRLNGTGFLNATELDMWRRHTAVTTFAEYDGDPTGPSWTSDLFVEH